MELLLRMRAKPGILRCTDGASLRIKAWRVFITSDGI